MNFIGILKWAAGVTCPSCDGAHQCGVGPGAADNRRMLDLLLRHRLDGRFVARCSGGRPDWCDWGLLAGALAHAAEAEVSVRAQCDAVRELAACLPAEKPVIVLKGAMVYALTGSGAALHQSADIDLLCDDVDAVRAALKGLGYRDDRGGMMVRGAVVFEARREFLSQSYPDDLRPVGRRSEHGQLFVSDHNERRAGCVGYEEVLARSMRGVTPDTCDLVFPEPAMAALILCGHIAGDYLVKAFTTGSVVRLGELADVCDLARSPGFDRDAFLDLAARCGAERSVALVGRLVATFMDRGASDDGRLRSARSPVNPLPLPPGSYWEQRTSVLPQLLRSFSGLWAAPRRADEALWRDMSTLAGSLGINELRAAADGEEAPRYGTRRRGARRLRALTRGGACRPAVEIGARWTSERLELEASVLGGAPRFRPDVLSFRFDRNALSSWTVSLAGAAHRDGTGAEGVFERDEAGYRLRVALPWDERPGSEARDESVCMLFGLVRWEAPPEGVDCLCRTPGRHCAEDGAEGIAHTTGMVVALRIVNPNGAEAAEGN